ASASIRSADTIRALQALGPDAFIAGMQEYRRLAAGEELSASTVEILTNVLSLTSKSDDALEEARASLDELLPKAEPPTPTDDGGEGAAGATSTARAWVPADFTTTASQRLAALRAGRGR